MAKSELPRPTDSELEILNILWTVRRGTLRQVYEAICDRRTAQYSTILKFMQIMTDKGILIRDESERAHVYEAAQSR